MNKIGSYLNFHAQALELRSRRNEILASNIANAATPSFKARDLDFDAEIKRHVGIGPYRQQMSSTSRQRLPQQAIKCCFASQINPSLDGNTVELSVEQMEFSENVTRYQTTLTFLNNRITGLMSAIKGE